MKTFPCSLRVASWLRVAAEHEYRVPPLFANEAVDLFTARARGLLRDFQPDRATEEICSRLDYLPLAVELAAAHVRTLTPPQILARLDRTTRDHDSSSARRTGAPSDVARNNRVEPRPSRPELRKRLFARLAVFAGGCTFDAEREMSPRQI